mmetsp:Transcript_19988/g.52347  ORF Transcript_19988/g.52347 Transcript_19988/m.52347 type:complete len:319 (+) Transcript_19988:157-1113(+)
MMPDGARRARRAGRAVFVVCGLALISGAACWSPGHPLLELRQVGGRRLLRAPWRALPRRGNVAQRAVPGGEGSALAPFQELTETLSTLDLYRGESGDGRAGSWTVCEESGAWVRFPDTTPWGVVYFIGGAGFGTYPHVAYDSLLGKLSTACGGGLVAIAWPYDVGLNHVQIAKDAAAGFETALARFSERESWSPRLKEFSIGHSLGAKLQLLNAVDLCAEGDEGGEDGERVSPPNNLALISLNNAGIADSLPLALRFLSTVNAGAAGAAQQFDFIVQLAKTAVEASGLEFYPSPTVTEAFVADSELNNVALFRFDDDE